MDSPLHDSNVHLTELKSVASAIGLSGDAKMQLLEYLMRETDESQDAHIEKTFPWKIEGCDIHDSSDNWIGEFADPEYTEMIVNVMNFLVGYILNGR